MANSAEWCGEPPPKKTQQPKGGAKTKRNKKRGRGGGGGLGPEVQLFLVSRAFVLAVPVYSLVAALQTREGDWHGEP